MKSIIGTNKRNSLFRIWFEGQELLAMGLEPNARYDLTLNDDGTITGTFSDEGKRKVSSKSKGGNLVPVLDLNNKAIHAWLEANGSPDAATIEVTDTQFIISPATVSDERKANVKRFVNEAKAEKAEQFWTARREQPAPYFHMVANGDAIFTSKTSDAFRCTDENDCAGLCEALEDTSPDGWRPELVTAHAAA